MKLILFLLVVMFSFFLVYDFFADITQDVIASNNGSVWAPHAQKIFAAVSYYAHQYQVAREAYAMQLKLFPTQADHPKALFRIAKSSQKLSEYHIAAKYYKELVTQYPKDRFAKRAQPLLADVQGVYLEFSK